MAIYLDIAEFFLFYGRISCCSSTLNTSRNKKQLDARYSCEVTISANIG